MSGMMGLYIGINALKAQQRALDVTGHNIANANTPGFSRQRAELTTTEPYTMPSMYSHAGAGQLGTGVQVSAVVRMRDSFIDERIRDTSANVGEWKQRANTLSELETILAEPSDDSLRGALDKFWSSLQELYNNPESGAVRAAVRESAEVLCDVFGSLRSQMAEVQKALNGSFQNKITEVNTTAQKISDLNKLISQVTSRGENANDLMDERDLLIDKLSTLANINVSIDSRNRANVSIGGFSLISGTDYSELTCVENQSKGGLMEVRWKETNNELYVTGGEIAGIYASRDEVVAGYMEKLDSIASSLITEFNKVHQMGFGLNNSSGIKFFSGTDASNIRISDEIMDKENGLNNIAASLVPDKPGDGRNASKLGDVLHSSILSGNKSTINDYWGGMIAQLGIDGQRAHRMEDGHTAVLDSLEQQRSSVSGVSLDEEMSNLIVFQHAYNAAAKLISTQSEMLDSLLSTIS